MKPRIEGKEDTRAGEVSFKPIHPTESARSVTSVGDKRLPDWQGIDGDEKRWKRCKQCGFILDAGKCSRGSGRGNQTFDPISDLTGADTGKVDPVVGAGCPMCGASAW
jgi:hypothetical protein